MAFPGVSADKTDVARRTGEPGRGGLSFPVTGLPEVSVRVPSCSGCPKVAAHDVCSAIGVQVPLGEHLYERVPAANVVSASEAMRLQGALHLLGYVGHGYIGDDVRFNAGAANNGSQFVEYEVTAASGSTLTLRGRNPKRLAVGVSRVNPEWPGADPVTGSYARIIEETQAICLPVGAAVEFLAPSVLRGKLAPLVTEVNPPVSDTLEGVTFTLGVNANVANAREPEDAFFPPADGVYRCRVRFEAARPASWKNFQAPRVAHWARRERVFEVGEEVALTDSLEGSTRVLWPGIWSEGVRVWGRPSSGPEVELSTAAVVAILETVESGAGWATTLDLTSVIDGVTYVAARVVWWSEAVASAADSRRLVSAGSCAHAQEEWGSSYQMHVDGSRCADPGASEFGDFRGRSCWKPGRCSGFAVGDAAESAGDGDRFLPADLGDASWWAGLWTRGDWFLKQGIPGVGGVRNFELARPAVCGPSVASLGGTWQDEVPGGLFPGRTLFHAPVWGARVTWTDGGDAFQELVHGAWIGRAYDFTGDGGPDRTWTAGGTPSAGWVAAEVAGWSTKPDGLGGSMVAARARFPWRGCGLVEVYEWELEAGGAGSWQDRVDVDAAVTGMGLSSAEDTAVTTSVRARWE